MANTQNVDQFFDAVTEAYDALLDAVKTANDRGYRISRRIIDEVERGQRESIDMTRKLALAPRDLPGFSSSVIRSLTEAQGRTLDLTRSLLDELTEGQREGRDTIRKVIDANRNAGQAAIQATREVVSRGAAVADARVNGVRARVGGRKRAAAEQATETSA